MVLGSYPRRRGSGVLVFILYLIFGLYFINYAFNFVQIPSAIASFDKWIIFAGGILIIIGAINHLRLRYRHPY